MDKGSFHIVKVTRVRTWVEVSDRPSGDLLLRGDHMFDIYMKKLKLRCEIIMILVWYINLVVALN